MSFDQQKARKLATRAPPGIDVYSRRKYTLSAALDRIAELEAEGKRALEVIDNQAAEIRDLRERLAGRGAT